MFKKSFCTESGCETSPSAETFPRAVCREGCQDKHRADPAARHGLRCCPWAQRPPSCSPIRSPSRAKPAGASPDLCQGSRPPRTSGMGQREHRRPCPDPPFSLSFSVSPLYIPRLTCLCFLSSMLWQWCSMLMRQCVVQPQAVIFQVISRVLNTRLLLFHLPSSRSGSPCMGRDPGRARPPQAAPGWSSTIAPVEEPNPRPLLLPHRVAGEAPGEGLGGSVR